MASLVSERGRTPAPQKALRALTAALGAACILGLGLVTPAAAGTLQVSPKAGEPGDGVVVSGAGWSTKHATVAIMFDGEPVGEGEIDAKGNLAGEFKVPWTAAEGLHVIRVCAPDASTCEEEGTSEFLVLGVAPPIPTVEATPKPTEALPTKRPTATPGATRKPAASAVAPSPSPSWPAEPLPVIDALAPIYAPPPGGWPTILGTPLAPTAGCAPPAGRTDVWAFDNAPVGSRTSWVGNERLVDVVGQIGQPLVETQSGRFALTSQYDDFGSAGRHLAITFRHAHPWVSVRIGRDAPLPGGDTLTAVLTGYTNDAGTWLEVARAQMLLPALPTPIRQCLRIDAAGDARIQMIRLDYLEPDGRSAYERRWLDDLTTEATVDLRGAVTPRITITAPGNEQVLEQLPTAPVRLTLDIHDATQRNLIELVVNGVRVPAPFTPASDGVPGHFRSEVYLTSLPTDVEIPVSARIGIRPEFQDRYYAGLAAASDIAKSSFKIRPPVTGNLLVTGIEPIQVTQTPSLGVGLVSGKSTAIRVYLQGIADSRGAWRLSDAVLTTRDARGVERKHWPVNVSLADGFQAPPFGSDRNRLDDSLLYVLTPEETRPGRLELAVSILGPPERPETSTADNTASSFAEFRQGAPMEVYAFLGSYLGRPGGTWQELRAMGRAVEGMFPVTTFELVPLPFIGEGVVPFRDLGDMQGSADRWLVHVPGDIRIFGLRPDTACYGNPPPRTCEAGWSWFRRNDGWRGGGAAAIMAQELSHSHNLVWHAQTPGEWAEGPYAFWNPEWPYYHTSIGHPGLDWGTRPGGPALVSGSTGLHVHDYMSYAGAPSFVSPFTYCDLGKNLYDDDRFCAPGARTEPPRYRPIGLGQAPFGRVATSSIGVVEAAFRGNQPAAVAGRVTADDPNGWRLAVSGTIETDGSVQLGLAEPVYRPDEGAEDLLGGEYVVELLDVGGEVLAKRGFVPVATHRLPNHVPVHWSLLLPAREGVAAIVVRRLGRIVAEQTASANAPTVTLLQPPADATWEESPVTVRWQAADIDGDPVVVTVLYSADDGVTWWPITVQSDSGFVEIDPATAPASERGRLRLTATDGVHTTVTDFAGTIRVPDHPPVIEIAAAADGMTIRPGKPLVVTADAMDVDEPELGGTAIRWTVDGGAERGTGPWVVLETLTPGSHRVTATVTDRAGQLASATITVVVAGPSWTGVDTAQHDGTTLFLLVGAAVMGICLLAILLMERRRRRASAAPRFNG